MERNKPGHPRALVLSPTRELAAQTCENHVKYAKYTQTRYACVFGGVNQFSQVKDIRRGADVVIATPGRLIDLMTQGIVYLDKVEYFVSPQTGRLEYKAVGDEIRYRSGASPSRRSGE